MVGPKRSGPKITYIRFPNLLKRNEKLFGIQKIAEKISQEGLFVPFGPKCMYPFFKTNDNFLSTKSNQVPMPLALTIFIRIIQKLMFLSVFFNIFDSFFISFNSFLYSYSTTTNFCSKTMKKQMMRLKLMNILLDFDWFVEIHNEKKNSIISYVEIL